MSIVNPRTPETDVPPQSRPLRVAAAADQPQPSHATAAGSKTAQPENLPGTDIDQVLETVQQKIAPVWPLQDYVAVNPYAGLASQKFLAARQSLRSISDLETFMPVDYYREQFREGRLRRTDIDAAVDELVADGVTGAERIDVNQVVSLLQETSGSSPTADAEFTTAENPGRRLRTFAETLDRHDGSHWCRVIRDEISKHCSTHYDEGQAVWSTPWQDMPLYLAWRSAAQYDRTFEIEGVAGFRKLVAKLPFEPRVALVVLLRRLSVPEHLWEAYLHCAALSLPGWSAWTSFRDREALDQGDEANDFAGLLAMRLTYEVALSEHFAFKVNLAAHTTPAGASPALSTEPTDEDVLRYALLRSSEIAFRRSLLSGLSQPRNNQGGQPAAGRRLAQLVFCIDVRSERIRRHLESVSGEIETYGFAGFFGLPIEFVPLGQQEGSSHVPPLLRPQFQVHEQISGCDPATTGKAAVERSRFRFLRKAWKEFQSAAASCFAFVETTGLFYGFKLLARSVGRGQAWSSRFDGVATSDRNRLGPALPALHECGCPRSRQGALAESILRGIGIVDDFARLVVFCGHGSQTENNPLKAGLDCGACGGHSGEANARLAAKLLNQTHVRQALAARGIHVPQDTHFVAALHNTTTDELELLDTDDVPPTHQGDLLELREQVTPASHHTRLERLALLPGPRENDLFRRSTDWSEVRPEWGLAGNAAFIAAPRALTASLSLAGRSFLHSYDSRNDPQFTVLEQIMTAPLVVAQWINMQYYASTVDPVHFGSGNKTLHNIVGRFGVQSGNGGDLMTGLPWQSVHDGCTYQHHPLRLLAVLAAPRSAIDSSLDRHEPLNDSLTNGWLQLVAIDEGRYYRYTEQQHWEEVDFAPAEVAAAPLA